MTKRITSFTGAHRFLSNFYSSPLIYEGILYPTVEHAYNALKTENLSERLAISMVPSPGVTKKDSEHTLLREGWGDLRYNYMRELVDQKFDIHVLAMALINTENYELIEGNHWGDIYWGICNGQGDNNLGKILMNKRQRLLDQMAMP